VHVGLTERALAAARAAGATRFIQISALGAAADAPSRYLRSKAEAEARLRAAPIAWTNLRPSVIYGREDAFINLFAGLARLLPVLVIPCPDARFQPIHVDDVAQAVVSCLGVPDTIGQTLELGGPDVFTMRELMVRVGIWTGTRRPVLGLPVPLSMLQAAVFEWLPGPLMSRDNVRSMQVPNVCAGGFPALLGFSPAAMDRVVPEYLGPDDGRARYSRWRGLAGR
jgi:NADH dehydrogenase